jgi:hypothetical protein
MRYKLQYILQHFVSFFIYLFLKITFISSNDGFLQFFLLYTVHNSTLTKIGEERALAEKLGDWITIFRPDDICPCGIPYTQHRKQFRNIGIYRRYKLF